jgi:hypothetical protein
VRVATGGGEALVAKGLLKQVGRDAATECVRDGLAKGDGAPFRGRWAASHVLSAGWKPHAPRDEP